MCIRDKSLVDVRAVREKEAVFARTTHAEVDLGNGIAGLRHRTELLFQSGPKACDSVQHGVRVGTALEQIQRDWFFSREYIAQVSRCLLYTSDAADERSSVDLGGRRS